MRDLFLIYVVIFNGKNINMTKRIITFSVFIILLLALFWFNFTWKNEPKPQVPKDAQNAAVTGWPVDESNYKNDKLKFTLKLPEGFKVENSGDYSILVKPEGKESGKGGTNFIYISVITADNKSEEGEIYNFNEKNYQALIKLKVGESISLGDKNQPNLNQWFTYKRLEDVEIGGNTSLVFENNKPWEFPSGTSETRFIFTKNDTICLLGFYTGGEVEKTLSIDSEVARSVIKSLQLK
ncbi:MAG: hypothetical protein US39_C0006G0041 [Microgenomates group bacterium GW2011_GWC1_37_12b]|uniref:Uncharacterized protein n=1 Tax=Candidatus Woesebacteria bacterium GW2011_GWB1_38_8b TaxID=1618571 RepID=A0A0G0PDP7_9BACT|nr:MAG: hypothetical protein US39_C0006G0041 [Microgenomates group bacterium GW2011_GWC1_37_12b]KKQ87411.1 MAG: hypothetical protein UT10_C0007G0069 [Candidatus Woesebacteria bacterium GW2011_GWB1_38_8b]